MKELNKSVIAFFLGAVIGYKAQPILHVVYIALVIASFFAGKFYG